jgi:hypothetical protein
MRSKADIAVEAKRHRRVVARVRLGRSSTLVVVVVGAEVESTRLVGMLVVGLGLLGMVVFVGMEVVVVCLEGIGMGVSTRGYLSRRTTC